MSDWRASVAYLLVLYVGLLNVLHQAPLTLPYYQNFLYKQYNDLSVNSSTSLVAIQLAMSDNISTLSYTSERAVTTVRLVS